jgi:hypothetical protein
VQQHHSVLWVQGTQPPQQQLLGTPGTHSWRGTQAAPARYQGRQQQQSQQQPSLPRQQQPPCLLLPWRLWQPLCLHRLLTLLLPWAALALPRLLLLALLLLLLLLLLLSREQLLLGLSLGLHQGCTGSKQAGAHAGRSA